MTAKSLMIQGTSSSAGKSLLVTALCHSFARRGIRVAPFKAQNMSNNAAVCPDGAEIGRAQALQAVAAGLQPHADMNPILLKPEADAYSQVVVMGRHWKSLPARQYYLYRETLWREATAALDRLRAAYDLIIIEGAGSPVELNLKAGDFVNMAVALYAQAPVLLVGDIDRGGIFAQLLGTLWLLPLEERELVKGLVVNKFRGDISLFTDGIHILEEKGNVPVLGVIPYLNQLYLPEEDAVALEGIQEDPYADQPLVDIAILRLPRISNFDDFDPLVTEPGVRVRYVDSLHTFGKPQAVILPGTKSTLADLEWLRSRGLDGAILQFAGRGGAVVGICGGYQMLGQMIRDPAQVESGSGAVPGLGLLPVETIFTPQKETFQATAIITGHSGWMAQITGQPVEGYEIHMGQTHSETPWIELSQRNREPVSIPDGAGSPDGKIWGCYLHGFFANERVRRAWLVSLGWEQAETNPGRQENPFLSALSHLTDAVDAALDMDRLQAIIWGDKA